MDQKNGKINSVGYGQFLSGIVSLLNNAKYQAARSVNAILTATYWEMGRRIIEYDQKGSERAGYGFELLERLSRDLTNGFGRGYSTDNLENMRLFYLAYRGPLISETLSRKTTAVKSGTPSRISELTVLAERFQLSWSHYVMLIRRTHSGEARAFYETETLRGGWSVRQLDRQIASQFYERTALSRDKSTMLRKGAVSRQGDTVSPEEEIKDPYLLEFLGLKDEYSESDLEEALIRHLEHFLMELGGDFAFIGRQKRLRIGHEWFRVDLLFFHRRLRCLMVLDLKVGKFAYSDAGQMHLYLNYARRHWTLPGENPPVGLILCTEKDNAVARYALEGLTNKIMTAEYKVVLPDEKRLVAEIVHTRKLLERRKR